MKYNDITRLHEAGLITAEQRQNIIAHYDLKEEGGRFLAIVSMIGAVLITAGIVLLISANWNEIPRSVKIAAGVALMLGAHAAGWWLRAGRGDYRKTGEALHVIGAGLFLGNIALLGQIYHLVSRPPNAILLWWAGIAALPWILRSKALHILSLLAFGLWFGLEVNERGWLFFGNDENQILLYALLGLIYLGAGYVLRGTRYAEFAGPTEKLGLLGLLCFTYPLTWDVFGRRHGEVTAAEWLLLTMCVAALGLIGFGVSRLRGLTRQWRGAWFLALVSLVAMLVGTYYWQGVGTEWIAALVLFVFCLLQIQMGLQERAPFMVNLGIAFIALDIIATYIRLIGSMGRTGVMFLISGVFLIVFGIYLEKKRRRLMAQIKNPAAERSAL